MRSDEIIRKILTEPFITKEIRPATKFLKNNKAPRLQEIITTEAFRYIVVFFIEKLRSLCSEALSGKDPTCKRYIMMKTFREFMTNMI